MQPESIGPQLDSARHLDRSEERGRERQGLSSMQVNLSSQRGMRLIDRGTARLSDVMPRVLGSARIFLDLRGSLRPYGKMCLAQCSLLRLSRRVCAGVGVGLCAPARVSVLLVVRRENNRQSGECGAILVWYNSCVVQFLCDGFEPTELHCECTTG